MLAPLLAASIRAAHPTAQTRGADAFGSQVRNRAYTAIAHKRSLRIGHSFWFCNQQTTVVIVTHNMQQAGRVSDRTTFMHLGVLIEEGPTDQIFTNPKNEMTERYVEGRFG